MAAANPTGEVAGHRLDEALARHGLDLSRRSRKASHQNYICQMKIYFIVLRI
jgi:hypothetical protein